MLGVLSTEEVIDLDRIGAVGFSFGGSAALLAAMRNARIGAVASLDGAVGFQHVLALTRRTEGFSAARLRAPLLHLQGADAPWRDLSLVEELRLADRFWVDLSGGEHLDFISAPSMRHAVGMSVPPARLAHYQTVAKVLLAFLESSLDTPALAAPAIRSALDDGPLPREAFRFTAMPRTTDVPTGYEFWRAMAEPRTTLEAIERYRDASARLPGIPLMASGRFDRAGSALLEDHASLAVAVMVLWIEVYPRCVAAHVNLGDARLATGDLAGAKTAYEAALRLDEGAVLAREGLSEVARLRSARAGGPRGH